MKSNKKFIFNIIAVVLIIGLLGGGIYLLSRPEPAPTPEEIYADDRIEIFSAAADDIIGASVTNKYGSYELVRTGTGWEIAGFDGIGLNAAMLDNLTSAFSNVLSSQKIEENPSDLAVYGLDEPTAIVGIKTSGSEKTFFIGNKTPDGSSCYFNTDSSADVYLLESYVADVALLTARDYAGLGSGFTAEDITEIRIASGKSALHVVMDEGGARDQYGLLSYWSITEPEKGNASNSQVSEVLAAPLAELEANASAIIPDTAENRAQYGLSAPEFTLEVTAGEKITYTFGAAAGEYRYFIRGGSGCILRTDDADCTFLYTTAFDISEKYLALIDINLLSGISVSFGGKTTELALLDPSGENAAFYIDGNEVDADSFRALYQKLVAIPVSGEAVNPSGSNAVGSVAYRLSSGESITLELTPYDDRNYAAFINGRAAGTVLKKNAQKIFDAVNEF